MAELQVENWPDLKDPWLVAAFDGWPNAGGVSIQALQYLRDKLGAAKFAQIAPAEFYGFAVLRPITVIKEGLVKGVKFPTNDFYAWKNPAGGRDLILFLGTEPHLRWLQYLDCVFQVISQFQVGRTISLGSTFDKVPHTMEPRLSSSVNDPAIIPEVKALGIGQTDYMGPCSIHTVMQETLKERHVQSLSLWGHVPHYLQVGNPQVTLALLTKLLHLLAVEADLTEIRRSSQEFRDMLNQFMAQKAELQEYVRTLEEEALSERGQEGSPERAERLMREVEDFLRREQHRPEGDGPGAG
ncbi:MAG: PAC2 family protein [Chloroflexi bacterium]|nr:PAC2 family protein [Chloroflexota bacterium]